MNITLRMRCAPMRVCASETPSNSDDANVRGHSVAISPSKKKVKSKKEVRQINTPLVRMDDGV